LKVAVAIFSDIESWLHLHHNVVALLAEAKLLWLGLLHKKCNCFVVEMNASDTGNKSDNGSILLSQ
jgi:hypothetical protein